MYFPYFYGRQSEFLALRDIEGDLSPVDTITPVIEPVLLRANGLVRCMKDLGTGGMSGIVIINPSQGEFKGVERDLSKQWRGELDEAFEKYERLCPAFNVTQTTTKKMLDSFLKRYPDKSVGLILSSPALSNAELGEIVSNKRVRYCGCFPDKMSAVQRGSLPSKKVFEITDGFVKLKRNSDYAGQEFFTDRHLNFQKNSIGFGDYLALGAALSLTGGQPHAIAIHLTYKRKLDSDIWIEHFVSTDIDKDVGTIGNKYLQAVEKLVAQIRKRRNEFGNNEALKAYESDLKMGKFPNLPSNKRRQIRHHLSLMHQVLSGEI
ncbi:hypothetical protein J2X56_003023 [Herbaspirillum sp. 1173]|uniref:sce7725 family protein n=1 Tax=Herbaspirillum sp. 1173 TaxID=2817734 RepID=UPI0028571A76|nr:sce7725 family protein [Herbaspirillum sp. 1173]MDR6740999.1 hypothetical protein [Herbaspirillum sp. 1173]